MSADDIDEGTPLLVNVSSTKSDDHQAFSWIEEAWTLVELGAPACAMNFSFIGMGLIESIVSGHLGTSELSAVSYAQILMDLSVMCFTQGFNQGFRNLASQVYGAATRRHDAAMFALVGELGFVTLVSLLVLSCPVLVVCWWYVGPALALAEFETSETLSTLYSRGSIPSLAPRLLFQFGSSYFLAQHIIRPTACIAVLFFFVHAGLTPLLVFGVPRLGFSGLGFSGLLWSMNLTSFARCGVFWYVMCFRGQLHVRTWTRATHKREVVVQWKHYADLWTKLLQAGGPIVLGVLFENTQLQLASVFAGSLGQVALAAHASMLDLFLFCTSPIYGLRDSASVRMGYYLGRENPKAARGVSTLLLMCVSAVALVIVLMYVLFQSDVGRIFSTDAQVIDIMTELAQVAATGYFFLSGFYFSMSILSAQNRPLPILLAFTLGAWGVGIPSAYVLKEAYQSVVGIWIGLALGYFMTTSIGLYFALSSDWTAEAAKAAKAVKASILT